MTEQDPGETHKRQRLSLDGATPAGAPRGGEASAAPPAAAAQAAPLAGAARASGGSNSSGGRLVLVWDLDETLLLFNSLLVGTWAVATQRPEAAGEAAALGVRWEAAILALCDGHFYFDQLEEWDQCCLADIQRHDDGASLAGYRFDDDGFPPPGPRREPRSPQQHAAAARPAAAGGSPAAAAQQHANGGVQASEAGASPFGSPACASLDAGQLARLAYRYRRIAKLCSFGLAALGTAVQRQEWEALYRRTDALTGGWLSHARALLAACTARLGGGPGGCRVTHVAVTSGQLVPSLAKLLLFQLGDHLVPEHLWSSRHCGKAACFQLVRRRFGAACTYVAIGDGMEEDEAAAGMGWPYIRVLLAPAGNYPADRVLGWRPDAATGGPGLPFTQLTLQHVAVAAGVLARRPCTPGEAAHGGLAAARALAAEHGS